ncbi:hypothetical protein HHK36_016665 [Tetracentron sinense]|uniref:S-acyltransferase n=1 Tax=Tetracentron sinense TaxID=13715 RepID=A0A835DB60_TETSI|nr:hypothetical protein HHK36_016665 [Tetracentron sinense]
MFFLQKESMKIKRFLSIPVLLVLLLMGFVYNTTVFIFIENWLGLKSSSGILNTFIFSCIAFMCVFSFSASVLMDPGYVPSTFIPDIEDGEVSDQGSKKNYEHTFDGELRLKLYAEHSLFVSAEEAGLAGVHSRHCDKCCRHKPPRAHHCRVCRSCVLRMDHHCLWINNCVGYLNYKYFVILVLYAAIGSIYSTYYEGIRAMWLARKSGQRYRHPFNLGAYKNIVSILGPNMLKWLCPTAVSHLKDGMSFPTSRDSS